MAQTLSDYCSLSYPVTVPSCVNTYSLSGFTADTDYVVIGVDIHGNNLLIDESATSNGSGVITFSVPSGYDTEHSSGITLRFYNADDYLVDGILCDPFTLTICTVSYNSIHMKFHNNVLDQTTHTIICPCE